MSSYGSSRLEDDQFPAGLRVLVVDDDITCLKILEQMLRRCRYRVTKCCQATVALSLLRERRGSFDVVISDVHMPDMDGFKLLELVGLEMDLPVIMMSADGSTSAVMRGIKHGACDYLIKPVRIEELKNIWQHVIRKKWNGSREVDNSCSMEDSDREKRVLDDPEYASSVNDGADGSWKSQKKKRDADEDEDDGELDNEDPSTSKKPRVVWSVELHQQFVSAVSQLGIEKAVPKRILELMNVPGLTRENVASHLQKFRLYLKRLSGVPQHQNGLPNALCGPVESNTKLGSLGRLDFQALAASGQIPPQTLAALHAELLGQSSSSLVLPAIDQPVLQASMQGPKCISAEQEVAFGQPLFKCQSSMSKQFPLANIAIEDMSSGYSIWPSNHLTTTSSASNIGTVANTQNGSMMVQALQQQQLYPVLSDSHQSHNVQPSCLVVPSQPLNGSNLGKSSISMTQNSPFQLLNHFQVGNGSVAITRSHNFNNSSNNDIVVDYRLLSSQSDTAPLCVGQLSNGDFKNMGVLTGYATPGSLTSSLSSLSDRPSAPGWRLQNSNVSFGHATGLPSPHVCTQSFEPKIGTLSSQAQVRNLGFVGKGMCIPSRLAVDDVDSSTNDPNLRKTCINDDGDRLKQEVLLDFKDSSKIGNVVLPHFSSTDFMGVLSK